MWVVVSEQNVVYVVIDSVTTGPTGVGVGWHPPLHEVIVMIDVVRDVVTKVEEEDVARYVIGHVVVVV